MHMTCKDSAACWRGKANVRRPAWENLDRCQAAELVFVFPWQCRLCMCSGAFEGLRSFPAYMGLYMLTTVLEESCVPEPVVSS